MAKRLVINCNSLADFIINEMAKDGFVVSDIKGVPGREVVTFKNSKGEIATAECGFTPVKPSNYRVKLKTMDEKDFVSFETAKRLKTAGFDELCNYYYTSEDTPKEHIWLTGISELANFNEIATNNCPIKCSAPMLWQAAKWLREVKVIDITISVDREIDETVSPRKIKRFYECEVTMEDDEDYIPYSEDEKDFPSYEAALSAGIDAVLNLIIEQK